MSHSQNEKKMCRDFYISRTMGKEIVILLVWVWTFCSLHVIGLCPKVCQCNWRNGKQWVTCTDAKFIDIPRGLEPSTQVLNLQHNNLKILFTDAFYDRGLVNLQKVFLSHCKLRKLSAGCFRKVNNLIELDLNSNFLTVVPSEALSDVSGLRELEMRGNNLTYLAEDSFSTTPDLVMVDVSFNNISAIHNHAFRSLTRLELLKISGNKITTVSEAVLKPLVSLHGFHIHYNPWNCDCVLRPLRQWMVKRNIVTSIPPACNSPKRLQGRQWKTLEINEFVCAPEVKAMVSRILATNGENVSLACAVARDSEVQVTWKVGDRLLTKGDESGQRYKVLELVIPEQSELKRVSNLTIERAEPQDQGTYRCVVENKAGRVETNVTLKVSEIIREEPLVALNEMFVAGVVLGALAFVFISAVVISVILYRRNRNYESKVKDDKINLPLSRLTNDEDREVSQDEFSCKPNNTQFHYESIPTTEMLESATSAIGNNIECEATQSNLAENELNDLDKKGKDTFLGNIKNNILDNDLPNANSNLEIPKAHQDQNPLLKNLAQQCREEIQRRKNLKKMKNNNSVPDRRTQYPDLLDFPKEPEADCIPKRSSTSGDIAKVVTFESASSNPLGTAAAPFTPDNYRVLDSFDANRNPPTVENYSMPEKSAFPAGESFDLEFHASQLEHFLQEYRTLQEQLFRIKESENIYANEASLFSKEEMLIENEMERIARAYSEGCWPPNTHFYQYPRTPFSDTADSVSYLSAMNASASTSLVVPRTNSQQNSEI